MPAQDRFNTKLSPSNFAPSSLTSEWVPMIDAKTGAVEGLETADAAAITNPASEITRTTRRIRKAEAGTHVFFRIAYPTAATYTSGLGIAVFGRTGTQRWEFLGRLTLVPSPSTDQTDGTTRHTDATSFTSHAIDRRGCEDIFVGVETALNLDGTNEQLAVLEAKLV